MTSSMICNTLYGDFKHGQPFEGFRCERINSPQQKDGLTSFLVLNVLEVKIFQYDFLEGRNV